MSNSNITFKISIESNLSYLPLLRKTIRVLCSSVIEDETIFQDIDICMNEALSNVIQHSYKETPGNEIQLIVTILPHELTFQIIDLGLKNEQLEPLNLPEMDINNLESIPESGRGLFIIHSLMDEVNYKTENGKNTLFLRKKIK